MRPQPIRLQSGTASNKNLKYLLYKMIKEETEERLENNTTKKILNRVKTT